MSSILVLKEKGLDIKLKVGLFIIPDVVYLRSEIKIMKYVCHFCNVYGYKAFKSMLMFLYSHLLFHE